MGAIHKDLLELGEDNNTVLIYEDFLNSKSLFLTPNSTSIYFFSWLKLSPNQPMVIETPANVLGLINNHFLW